MMTDIITGDDRKALLRYHFVKVNVCVLADQSSGTSSVASVPGVDDVTDGH